MSRIRAQCVINLSLVCNQFSVWLGLNMSRIRVQCVQDQGSMCGKSPSPVCDQNQDSMCDQAGTQCVMGELKLNE